MKLLRVVLLPVLIAGIILYLVIATMFIFVPIVLWVYEPGRRTLRKTLSEWYLGD